MAPAGAPPNLTHYWFCDSVIIFTDLIEYFQHTFTQHSNVWLQFFTLRNDLIWMLSADANNLWTLPGWLFPFGSEDGVKISVFLITLFKNKNISKKSFCAWLNLNNDFMYMSDKTKNKKMNGIHTFVVEEILSYIIYLSDLFFKSMYKI